MFQPGDRRIFEYHDGERPRFGDPTLIEERWNDGIEALDAEAMQEHLASPIREVRSRANAEYLAIIARALEVEPLDTLTGKGLTAEELFALNDAFWSWRDGVKKNTGSTPDGSPPSGEGPGTIPSPDASSSSTTASA